MYGPTKISWRVQRAQFRAAELPGKTLVLRAGRPILRPFCTSFIEVGLILALSPVFLCADAFRFDTGSATNQVAMASRPSSPGKIQIQAADDFILTGTTQITGASFTGLLPSGSSLTGVAQVGIEIYRVFPQDSTNPPFGQVPTREDSPAVIPYASRGGAPGFASELSFTTALLNPSFTAANSVLNGINPIPNQTTAGEGPVTGEEVLFSVNLTLPITLSANHYFFVPQVELSNGDFYWLSAARPIGSGGTPFAPDFEPWISRNIRSTTWLRVGTDILGATGSNSFNGAFSLTGETIPEPSAISLTITGCLICSLLIYRRR